MPRVSALPAASALDGSELEAVVQSGTTKKTTQADKIKQLTIKQVAYTAAIPFNWPSIVMAEKTVDADIVLTRNTTGAIPGAVTILRLIGDGTHDVDYTDFTEMSGSNGFVNTTGALNIVMFMFDGTTYWVNIKQDVATAPAGPYYLFENATSISDAGVTNVAHLVTNTNSGAWGNRRCDNKKRAAGTQVRIFCQRSASDHQLFIMGFTTTYGITGYSTMAMAVMLDTGGAIKKVVGSPGSTLATLSAGYVGILVDSAGNGKIQTSVDAVTWTDVSGGSFTTPLSVDAWPCMDQTGSGAGPGKLFNAQGTGLV